MGYGVVLIKLPGHVAVGVRGGEGIYGTYYSENGEKYFYLETTSEGWKIGETPDEISKALGEERRLVSYHLHTLEEYGFVSSKYEIPEHPKSRGKAIRNYWVNRKVEDVISELKIL